MFIVPKEQHNCCISRQRNIIIPRIDATLILPFESRVNLRFEPELRGIDVLGTGNRSASSTLKQTQITELSFSVHLTPQSFGEWEIPNTDS